MAGVLRQFGPWSTTARLHAGGVALFVALVAFLGDASLYRALYRDNQLQFFETITLTVITLGLFLSWSFAFRQELDICSELVTETRGVIIGPATWFLVLALSGGLACLVVTARDIQLYAALIVSYSLLDYCAASHIVKRLRAPLESQRRSARGP